MTYSTQAEASAPAPNPFELQRSDMEMSFRDQLDARRTERVKLLRSDMEMSFRDQLDARRTELMHLTTSADAVSAMICALEAAMSTFCKNDPGINPYRGEKLYGAASK